MEARSDDHPIKRTSTASAAQDNAGRLVRKKVERFVFTRVILWYFPFMDNHRDERQVNVLGGALFPCSTAPMTGFFRDGRCRTCEQDTGSHTVCAEMTEAFLAFSSERGNDLITPRPEWGFPGLKPGDRWCLCAARWKEAYDAGCAPPVILRATHVRALEVLNLEQLREHATM